MDYEPNGLFPDERPGCSCYTCRYFSELKEPRQLDPDGAIYGLCFKAGVKHYSGNGYAVFIPDGKCAKYAKRK